ncbi:hypothetical protein EMCRGX_G018980 [Ephydatia muelleri]
MDATKPPAALDTDTLIDEILAKKGPHKYKEGLSEDNWEEEIEQIPLFMSKCPDVIDPERAPALAALQQLKYEDATPTNRANAYKEEGNYLFKQKKYKEATAAYSEAIRQKCEDPATNAILYCNRAAMEYHLGNYRSSLMDCKQARKFKPDHFKAIARGAMCCVKLKRLDEAIEWCDEGLSISPDDATLTDLRSTASKEKKRFERDQRKEQMSIKAKVAEEEGLLAAIKSRGITLAHTSGGGAGGLSLEEPHPSGKRVHLDKDGALVWPVLFLYPEFGQTDLVEAFVENQLFEEHVDAMLGSERPPWDVKNQYTPSNVELYFQDPTTDECVPVDLHSTLGNVLALPRYKVVSGTPSFIVLAAGTSFREQFLKR